MGVRPCLANHISSQLTGITAGSLRAFRVVTTSVRQRPSSHARTGLLGWRTAWRTTRKAPANGFFEAVSKTVSGLWVRRGFKSLPLRSTEKPH
jgi:hypothetical protein